MTNKSIVSTKKNKPSKPYPDFPLFPHATGRWAKKICGKLHYFGYWNRSPDGDWRQALDLYQEQKDDLYAGRTPRVRRGGMTIRELCNRFLTTKRRLLDTGEITERTFQEYHSTCSRIVTTFGRDRLVDDLATDDFAHLRASLAETRGPVALGNEIQRCRSVFKFAYDERLIDKPVRYGQQFNKPSKKTLRMARNGRGPRMFEADELRTIIDTATQPLKAMILLGINCGFGQTDVSSLPLSAVDLDSGWVDYPRPKTGVERRCPLWPETVEAIRRAVEHRPRPKSEKDTDLAFITKYGHRWVKTNKTGTPDDAVGKEFTKLLQRLGLKRPGVSFYALRHTFETIAGESKDQVAVNAIMGHVDNSMAGVYRERISDERLRAVTDCVHDWLFGSSEELDDAGRLGAASAT